jgi:hypothetical protein
VFRSGSSRITTEHIAFQVRHDPTKLNNLKEFLKWKEIRKNFAPDEGSGTSKAAVTKIKGCFSWCVPCVVCRVPCAVSLRSYVSVHSRPEKGQQGADALELGDHARLGCAWRPARRGRGKYSPSRPRPVPVRSVHLITCARLVCHDQDDADLLDDDILTKPEFDSRNKERLRVPYIHPMTFTFFVNLLIGCNTIYTYLYDIVCRCVSYLLFLC